MTTVTTPAFTETDLETAKQLADDPGFWTGYSGEQATGVQTARHLDATLALLTTRGWSRNSNDSDPEVPRVNESMSTKTMLQSLFRWLRDMDADSGPLTLLTALLRAQRTDGDSDTHVVAGRVMNMLLRARTGASTASYLSWEDKQGRTFAEVRDLLETAAAFARTHGPA